MMVLTDKNIRLVMIVLISMVYLLGAIFIDFIEGDSAQYASISIEMLENHRFLEVYHHQSDYLDKPPLIFWLSSLSFTIFGISPFAYRLPSMLFTILGVFSTYRLAKMYYDEATAHLAAFMLITTQAWFLFNQDVRTDTILAGATIFAIWQIAEYLRRTRKLNFILGFLGIAMAMMAKGPIGFVVPVLAIGSEILYRKQWRNLWRPEWIIGLLLILVLLGPMMLGLYRQFDWTGLRFFFWTQSFGRITGESVWEDTSGYFFFTHTFLWAFLPWSFIAVYGLIRKIRSLITSGNTTEVLTLGGFLLPLVALSFSHFKLPHYINITFPFMAIIAARAFVSSPATGSWRKIFYYLHIFINLLFWIMTILIVVAIFPMDQIWKWVFVALFLGAALYTYFWRKNIRFPILLPSILSILGFNLILNVQFFPRLTEYQSGTQVARYITQRGIPIRNLYIFRDNLFTIDTGLEHSIPVLDSNEALSNTLQYNDTIWVFLDDQYLDMVTSAYPNVHIESEFKHFHTTLLNSQFLNPRTRTSALRKKYLLRFDPVSYE